jgi:hypothetical protein
MPDRDFIDILGENNPWQLYDSTPGWQEASAQLTEALTRAVTAMDAEIAGGRSIAEACGDAWMAVERVMNSISGFGATDSEPRSHLAFRLAAHVRKIHRTEIDIDRWGAIRVERDWPSGRTFPASGMD